MDEGMDGERDEEGRGMMGGGRMDRGREEME